MFNKIKKQYVLLMCLCFYLLLFKLILVGQFSALAVEASISEQQRQEIQRLKSELSEALATSDNANVATKGVIVQPPWTQDKSSKPETVKVQVNAQNRNEAAALRAEINRAIAKDTYVTADAAKSQDIKSLEASLTSKAKGKEALLLAVNEQGKPEEEQLGAGSFHQDDPEDNAKTPNTPNTIIANLNNDLEIDIRKLQSLEISKRRNREVLILKYIEEDFAFDLGAEVNEWKYIVHAGEEYFIGRRITDVVIVRKEADKYVRAMVVEIGHIITYIESYTYWNVDQEQQEAVILIATADKVLWYRANRETKLIELYWEWMVGNLINGLTHFTLEAKNYLLTISSNQSFLARHYSLNIYEYDLEDKEFWIAQRLQLEFPCQEVSVLLTGRDVILAIPQNQTAKIYTFNPHEAATFSHIRFQLKRSVPAKGITTIAGFKMGGRSYLALSGYQPQILLYQQGDFIAKTFLGNNFGWVELFFPIPVRTYRDDLILLVQHRVDFSTHSLTVVETLIWDGEAFETSIPVPCHMGKHVVYGVGCMLDLHRDEGLKGAALLKRGDEISIIVPRHKAESGLFRLHTEMLAKNSELLDLEEIFVFLKDWVKEQHDLVAEAEAFLQLPLEDVIKIQPDSTFIESLETPEFELHGNVGEIYVNDYEWSREDSHVDLLELIQNIEDLERSLNAGRQRRNLDATTQHDELKFDEIIVDDLTVETVNGQQYFIQNGELNFDGLINCTELDVLRELPNLKKRQLQDEDFILNGDLEFDKINGLEWSEIKKNLVFRTENQNFEDLEVRGEILIENSLTINTLNALNFPDDYLLSHGPATSTVMAEKHFVNTLSVSSVDTSGLVNGKNPIDAITLTDPQEWQGKPIFKQLEVREVLELHGQVHGRDVEKFPKNPTLQESNIITANCHFNEIIVNGSVVLKGEVDDKPLGSFLKDILLKTENPADEILITSPKSFNTVSFPIDFQLDNNSINEIPVNDFVTLHTKQTLNITSLEGYVYFYNLTLNGSYDGVRIEKLLKDVILLDRPVDLSSAELIFPENLKARSITILDTLNSHQLKDNLQTLQEDLTIEAASFESLQSQQADFANDIAGQGNLNNIELHSLVIDDESSVHEPPLTGNIFLNELILEKGIQTDELHGIGAEFLFEFLTQIDELPDMVLNGQIQIDQITVTGDVQLHKLNGLLFDEDIQLTTIKLQHSNFLSTNLSFQKRLEIKGQLNVIADFRGNYLPDLIDDIVVRTTNSCIEITAPKSFLQPLEVLQNTEIKALNGIAMNNIAWKTQHNTFNGSVHLKGNFIVENLNLNGSLNNFNWQDLEALLYYDKNLENFVLKNTIEFNHSLFLEDLTVKGDLNSLRNLSDFFENLIYQNDHVYLNGSNTFTGRVSIERGALITNLNGQNLVDLFNNLVFINGPEPVVIQAPVRFESSVQANEIQVENSLTLDHVSGCSLREWRNNSLRVDQDENITHPLNFAPGSLDGNSLLVNFINDKDLSRIITLNTQQTFNESVKFSEVVLNGLISCKGRVNNVNLEREFNNTLKTYGQQHIFTPLLIQNITILGDLLIRASVNDNKNLSDVATLQEDFVFKSPLYFQNITTPRIIFKDLVTGIDFNKWFDSAVGKYQPGVTQNITGNWSTKLLNVRSGPQEFQYAINGLEPWQYYDYIRLTRRSENNAKNEHQDVCDLVKEIIQDIAKKPVFVKYIEEYFYGDFAKQFEKQHESFNKVFEIKTNKEYYLIVNRKCESMIYKWLAEKEKFMYKTSFESGPVNEIEIMPLSNNNNSKKLEFITNFEGTENLECDLRDIKKWKVENDSVVLEADLWGSPAILYTSKGDNTSLWALHNETLKELDFDYKIKQKWPLPQHKTRYRFVPLKGENAEILLTNGEQMVLISNRLAKKSENSLLLAQQQPQLHRSNFNNLTLGNAESWLKPNNTLTHSFVFREFKPAIERILSDLQQRLNQQINITQLSIPESDLFDEYFVPDFLTIMAELQNQSIYDQEVFNISFYDIKPPEDVSQILAASVVETTWPVVMEIDKIQLYLKSEESQDQPLCDCISKSLGFLINDVLLLANEDSTTSKDVKLDNVIRRLREFERDLNSFLKAYTSYYDKEREKLEKEENDTEKEMENLEEENQLLESTTTHNINYDSQPQNDFMFIKTSFLPGYKQGEILSLVVGSVTQPQHLWAVTNTQLPLTGNNNAGIYLYLESVKGQLYQIISALEARSLQQLRIKQETLLLYVEGCCKVEILKYRGLQGFTTFAEIVGNETIKQILTISLPFKQGKLKYFLILLLTRDIKFYEFTLEGYDFIATPPIPLNCL